MSKLVGREDAQRSIPYGHLVATPYSGSTLLSLLLDSHPRIVSIGELDNSIHAYPADPPYLCSCGRPINQCDFFTQLRDLCRQDGHDLDLQNFRTKLGGDLGRNTQRLVFGSALRLGWLEQARDRLLGHVPTYRRHVRQALDRSCAIVRASLEVSGKDVFLDGSKGVSRGLHLLRRPQIDLRVVHVVRDARAVAWSALKRRRVRLGNSAHGSARIEWNWSSEKQERTQVENAARYWRRTHRAALRLCTLVGEDRYFRFRWEDFCAAPEPLLDQICEFLGVEPVDLLSRVNVETHHVIGNRIRLQPVPPIRADETWREALDLSQRQTVERYAGELNRSFGYT